MSLTSVDPRTRAENSTPDRRVGRPLPRGRRGRLGARLARLSLLHVVCIVLAVGVFAGPLLYLLLQSFKTYTGFLQNSTGWPSTFTLANYAAAWSQGDFGRQLINSFFYSAVPDVITLILGVFLAFPIARGWFAHSNLWYGFFLFSGFLPGALIPLFIEAKALHVYNNMPGFLLILSLQGAGFFFFVGYLKGIPREREEAAAMDGCGYVRFILTIILPDMKPALAAFAVFGFVAQWNNLILPLVLLPNQNLWPVTRGLYGFYGGHTQNWPLIAAGTVIVAIPLVIVFAILQRYLVAGVSGGALGIGVNDAGTP